MRYITEHIKTIEGFEEAAFLFRDYNLSNTYLPKFRRIFDKDRNWGDTIEWLNKNVDAQSNKLYHLLKLSILVTGQHERDQQHQIFDQWKEKRFIQFQDWLKKQLSQILSQLKSPTNKRKSGKPIYNTWSEAVKDPEAEKFIYDLLEHKKIINEQKELITDAVKLYGYIKRLKKKGYFKKITDTALHQLTNKTFNCFSIQQHFKQTPPATLLNIPQHT